MWRRFVWLLCLIGSCRGITVTDRATTEPTRNTTASAYRVSVPKTQQPSNRVPAHLQGVRSTGFAYDDADDVIHIIEPPQHFQQLKRQMQRQGADVAVWMQQRQVRITQPMKVKEPRQPFEQFAATKANRPAVSQRHQQQRLKPAGDLLPLQVPVPPPPFPLEILASVRKTERLLLKQHQQPQQGLFPRQRLKTKQSHTVVVEKAYDKEKFARDKEQRLIGQKWRQTRARRATNSDVETSAAAEALRGAQLDIEKGTKLLLRLKALLKNADAYLPADEYAANYSNTAGNVRGPAATELQKILESSLNATNIIMQQVERTRNATGAKRRAEPSPTSFASAATVKRVKKQDADSDELAHSEQPQPDRVVAATLLYDDVMTNIRNMLQAHNAKLLAEQQQAADLRVDGNADLDASAPVAVAQWGELQLYLQELQRLVTQLPSADAGPSDSDLTMNTREFIRGDDSGSGNRTAADWYLIDGKGQIFQTRLHDNLKPSTNLFHCFPDIPVDGEQQLINGNLEALDSL